MRGDYTPFYLLVGVVLAAGALTLFSRGRRRWELGAALGGLVFFPVAFITLVVFKDFFVENPPPARDSAPAFYLVCAFAVGWFFRHSYLAWKHRGTEKPARKPAPRPRPEREATTGHPREQQVQNWVDTLRGGNVLAGEADEARIDGLLEFYEIARSGRPLTESDREGFTRTALAAEAFHRLEPDRCAAKVDQLEEPASLFVQLAMDGAELYELLEVARAPRPPKAPNPNDFPLTEGPSKMGNPAPVFSAPSRMGDQGTIEFENEEDALEYMETLKRRAAQSSTPPNEPEPEPEPEAPPRRRRKLTDIDLDDV